MNGSFFIRVQLPPGSVIDAPIRFRLNVISGLDEIELRIEEIEQSAIDPEAA